MKLNLNGINNLPPSYKIPNFDISAMVARTKKAPTWLHIGAGNIFRILMAGVQQDLLNNGHADTGIIVFEPYDESIIPLAFIPHDNLTLAVTLHANGAVDRQVIASIADGFSHDLPSLCQVVINPSLQMVSLTITEKGYSTDHICLKPSFAITAIELVTAALFHRFQLGAKPIALVSMDNFAENGAHLKKAVVTVATAWEANEKIQTGSSQLAGFTDYVKSLSYPWTMVDKITPRPSEEVAKLLAADGFDDVAIHKTPKNTFVASFVNAESPEYLIIEDSFPNGRPPLEKAGVYMTDRETVRKMDQMKVCACLNPLHTVLAIGGMLLNKSTIADCMKDPRLTKLLCRVVDELMPTVVNPGIIDPNDFLREVLTERFPNPFIPDEPARIACDTSQKVPVRFGVTLKLRKDRDLPCANLEGIPLFIALWLRYRIGLDDTGAPMELSPDPRLPETLKVLDGLQFGEKVNLKPILSDKNLFGVDLYAAGLGEKIEALFYKLSANAWAVADNLAT